MIDSRLTIYEHFKTITKKDIYLFLQQVYQFFVNDKNNIIEYYNNNITSTTKKSFDKLNQLIEELRDIFEIIQLNSSLLHHSKWWDFIEMLEDIDSTLNSLKNYNRWSRSSLSFVGYKPFIQQSYFLQQKQSLERVSQDILQDDNPQDDWVNIARDNDLNEEKYTTQGGVEVKVTQSNLNKTADELKSVMDLYVGEKVLGIDVDKKIQFILSPDGFFDLKTLSYEQTLLQSVDILAQLKQNGNPEYPNDGIQSDIIVGGNRALLNFAIIIRQLQNSFATDDTIQSFQVQNIQFEQDNLVISYQIESRLGKTYNLTSQI